MIPLVLIVMAVETEQLPVTPVGRIVVVVMVLVMDRELAQLLAVKFASAMRTNPRKHFERLLSIGLLQLSLGAPCHVSLGEDGYSLQRNSATSLRLTWIIYEYLLCRPILSPGSVFPVRPSRPLQVRLRRPYLRKAPAGFGLATAFMNNPG